MHRSSGEPGSGKELGQERERGKRRASGESDPMDGLKIETDLKRSMLADIQHQRQVASYRGRRFVVSEQEGRELSLTVD